MHALTSGAPAVATPAPGVRAARARPRAACAPLRAPSRLLAAAAVAACRAAPPTRRRRCVRTPCAPLTAHAADTPPVPAPTPPGAAVPHAPPQPLLPPPLPPPPPALSALTSLALAARTLALLRAAAPSLLGLSAAAALVEHAIAFASYATLALFGIPDASYATLAVGVSGIVAGYAFSAFAKGAAYLLIARADPAGAVAADGAEPPLADAAAAAARGRLRRATAALAARAGALRAAAPSFTTVLAAELRRAISVAWQGFLTFPVPVFALPKLLDLALVMPLLALERAAPLPAAPAAPAAAADKAPKPPGPVGAALARSTALMAARRATLCAAALLLLAGFAAVAAAGAAALLAAVPSLASTLVPLPLPVGTTVGDVAASFASGDAFARVFEGGTEAQQAALTAAIAGGAILRWAAVAALRCLAYATWCEAAARGPVPPRTYPVVIAAAARLAAARAAVTEAAGAAAARVRARVTRGPRSSS
jgi:hypothetical protein